jgi:hypothetical protein
MSECVQRIADLLYLAWWAVQGSFWLGFAITLQLLLALRSLDHFLEARRRQIDHLMGIHDSPAVRRWIETRRAERRDYEDVMDAEFEVKEPVS